jgi:hypothetical protein
VTPFSLYGGDPSKVLATIVFRPEFQSLAATLSQLSSASSGMSARGNAMPFANNSGQTFDSSAPQSGGRYFAGSAAAATDADEDPGRPAPGDVSGEPSFDTTLARALANHGEVEPDSSEPPLLASIDALGEQFQREAVVAAAQAQTLPLNIGLARAFLTACMTSTPRVQYGLGKKVPFHGATPGRDFTRVDCSGFVREAIWRATSNPHFNFKDGSVVQHEWVRTNGFQLTTTDAAALQDGVIRIAFLRPQDSTSHIGHVALVHNGRTLESHGSFGPNSRPWTKTGWQARAVVYVLTPA